MAGAFGQGQEEEGRGQAVTYPRANMLVPITFGVLPYPTVNTPLALLLKPGSGGHTPSPPE